MRIGRFNLISTSNDILRKKKLKSIPHTYRPTFPPHYSRPTRRPNKTALTVLEHITRTRSYSIPACLAGPVLACQSTYCSVLYAGGPPSFPPGLLKWIQTTYILRGLFRPVLQRQQRPRLLLAPPPPPPFLLTTQLVEPPVRVLNARTPRPMPSRINPGLRRITRGREP